MENKTTLRRRFLAGSGAMILSGLCQASAFTDGIVKDSRVWTADYYTRATIYLHQEVSFRTLYLQNPERVVVDLDTSSIPHALASLPMRIDPNDPRVRKIRIARFSANTVRVVFDLKQPCRPDIFLVSPIAGYGYRLVVDLYPQQFYDAVPALVRRSEGQRESDTTDSSAHDPSSGDAKTLCIVIDPGHGGDDLGAIGSRGGLEKQITLSIARHLERQVNSSPNMMAFLTRDGDYFVPLRERLAKARRWNADLFISLHADGIGDQEAHGSSVYAFSERSSSSAEASWIAQRENHADAVGGGRLEMNELSMTRTLSGAAAAVANPNSLRLGDFILPRLSDVARPYSARVENAAFTVLRGLDIPSVLIETGFISNKEDEVRLSDTSQQVLIASALYAGISDFFSKTTGSSRA